MAYKNQTATTTWKERVHNWYPHHKKADVFDDMYYDSCTPNKHHTWREAMDARCKTKKEHRR